MNLFCVMYKLRHNNTTRKGFQMSLPTSISKSAPIRNFILALSFQLYFSKPVFNPPFGRAQNYYEIFK